MKGTIYLVPTWDAQGPSQASQGLLSGFVGLFPHLISNLCINYITLMDELCKVRANTERRDLQLEPATLVNTLKV